MYRIFIFEESLTFGCAKYKHSKVANICQNMSSKFGGDFILVCSLADKISSVDKIKITSNTVVLSQVLINSNNE